MAGGLKEQALARIEETHGQTMSFFRGLSEAELAHPAFGEGEGWRVRDLIPHIALWKSVSTRVAEKVAATDTLPDIPDWDIWAGELTPTPELNDRIFREWRDRPAEDRFAHLEATHRRLMSGLGALRPDQMAPGDDPGRLHEYIQQPDWRHPRTHMSHVRSALEPRSGAKQAFLNELEQVYTEAERRIATAPFDRPVFEESAQWTVHDLVSHIAAWCRVAARTARKLAWSDEVSTRETGGMRGYIGLPQETGDEFNARVTSQWRDRSRDDVVKEFAAAHAALIDALRVLPAAQMTDASSGRPLLGLWVAGYEHLRQHNEHLEALMATA